MTPTHLLRSCSMIIHCQQSRTCVCVRSASGFLRYLSSIVEDPFLIWAKCERNENASSLQDMAKKTCLRRFRLCQPSALCDNPRILSLPSPSHVQDHSHSGIVGGMGSRHVGYTKALLACDVLTCFDAFCFVNITGRQISTNPGGRNGCVLHVACLTPAPLRHLSSFLRQSPGWFGAF